MLFWDPTSPLVEHIISVKTGKNFSSFTRFRLILIAVATAALSAEGCQGALAASGRLEELPVVASTGPMGGAIKRELDLNLTYHLVGVSGAPFIRYFTGNRFVYADSSAAWDATGWEAGEAPERPAARMTGVWVPWNHDLPEEMDADEDGTAVRNPDFSAGCSSVWIEAIERPAKAARQRAFSPDPARPAVIPRMLFDRPVSPVKPVRFDGPVLGDLTPGLSPWFGTF